MIDRGAFQPFELERVAHADADERGIQRNEACRRDENQRAQDGNDALGLRPGSSLTRVHDGMVCVTIEETP